MVPNNVSYCQQVLKNSKLLIMILGYLEQIDLLISSEWVSKIWLSIITQSTMLGRVLFFASQPASASAPRQDNPLLHDRFKAWFTILEPFSFSFKPQF
jgi:hypothetical protein